MSHRPHEDADKCGDDPVEQVTLDAITVVYQ
jgi:hypothetical protein